MMRIVGGFNVYASLVVTQEENRADLECRRSRRARTQENMSSTAVYSVA